MKIWLIKDKVRYYEVTVGLTWGHVEKEMGYLFTKNLNIKNFLPLQL